MASREHLVPTLTVDKNGRQTTVYKKRTASANAVPVVAMPTQQTTPERREEMISSFMNRFEPMGLSDEAYERMLTALMSYPDELLARLDDALVNNDPGMGLVGLSVSQSEAADNVSENLYFFREVNDCSYYVARHLVDSLHHYPQLPESKDYSMESEEVRAQCSALMSVARVCANLGRDKMFNSNAGEYVLADTRLVELVMAHSGEASLITDFIRTHRSADVDLLTELLNGDSRALGNGRL